MKIQEISPDDHLEIEEAVQLLVRFAEREEMRPIVFRTAIFHLLCMHLKSQDLPEFEILFRETVASYESR